MTIEKCPSLAGNRGRLLGDLFRTFLLMPPRVLYWRMRAREWPSLSIKSVRSAILFLSDNTLAVGFVTRIALVERFVAISQVVICPHTNEEMFEVASSILRLPRDVPGVVVEAGSYKGGSACKLSLCAALMNRKLVIFDSFEGIPTNTEVQATADESKVVFQRGAYAGSLTEVKRNIQLHGVLTVCDFVKGWFCDTMPTFDRPIATGYLDVDLVSSTKDCLKYLYPHLIPNGILYSQDGHLDKIVELLDDEEFWRTELGLRKPPIHGLGQKKLVSILKDHATA